MMRRSEYNGSTWAWIKCVTKNAYIRLWTKMGPKKCVLVRGQLNATFASKPGEDRICIEVDEESQNLMIYDYKFVFDGPEGSAVHLRPEHVWDKPEVFS